MVFMFEQISQSKI